MSEGKHTVILEKREKASISGVTDVISFDEEVVVSKTSMGVLIIKGDNLHINSLNLENGELCLDGTIDSMEYEDTDTYNKPASSFFGKLFR